jgi:hypothetical protein
MFVYALSDSRKPESIRYIGKTIQPVTKRLAAHMAKSKHGKTRRCCWINSVISGGGRILVWTLSTHHCEAELSAAEIKAISIHRALGFNLTNLTDGGDGNSGWKPTEETLIKMSAAAAGKPKPPRSEAHRKNMSISKTGVKMPETTRLAIAQAITGKPRSEEVRKKISESNKGKKFSPEHKEKLRLAKLGKKRGPHSAEHKEKIRQSLIATSRRKRG